MLLFELIDPKVKHISQIDPYYLTEEAVSSSWIADLSYDEDVGSVIMTTQTGAAYEIPEVPYEIFQAWLSAVSKGKFWWSDIKGIFT